MTRRNPQSKGAAAVTARIVTALADDLGRYVKELRDLAKQYKAEPLPGASAPDFERTAIQIDVTLDKLAEFTKLPVWPRGYESRVILIRAGASQRGPVQQSVKLGPAKAVIIVCCDTRGAEKDVARETWRDPRDARIIYVSELRHVERTRGLDRSTPWMLLCEPARDGYRIISECRSRFEQRTKSLPELISMLDWNVIHRRPK